MEHLKLLGYTFYAIDPFSTMYEKLSDLPKPDHFTQLMPYFIGFFFVEHLILKVQGKPGIRLNEGIINFSCGIMMMLLPMLVRGVLLTAYLYIYDNWRVYELPWNSVVTWVIAAILCDFGYYWVHRASHEINFLWAAHQLHHSSEDFNLTTAFRNSGVMAFGNWPFYLPMAFFLPPTHMIIHSQFNMLWGFWSHTEIVDSLGPLEKIFITPKAHRVHHGSNRYALDKNYGSVLCIWDRMFGTFEEERTDQKIVYGLVDQPQFFNPLKHHTYYYGKIVEKAQSTENYLSAIFKGPGWFPGTPRLGDPMGVPEFQNRAKHDPKVEWWVKAYAVGHFVLTFLAWEDLNKYNMEMSLLLVWGICAFLFWTLTSVGLLFDNNPNAWPNEFVRCGVFLFSYFLLGAWKKYQVPYTFLTTAFSASMVVSVLAMTSKTRVKVD